MSIIRPVVYTQERGIWAKYSRRQKWHAPAPAPAPSGVDFAALWKLDETSGTVAHDSSGNGHHLEPIMANPPTWGQTVAPTGGTSALFVDDNTRLNHNAGTAMVALTDNFTAGIWVKFSTVALAPQELIGQGQAGFHAVVGQHGWALMLISASAALTVDGNPIYSDTTLSPNTWYFIAGVRDAGTWKLYVNGVLQASTQATAVGVGSILTWIGNDGYAGHTPSGTFLRNGLLSYGFMVTSVLTAAQLLAMYNA